MVKSTKVSQGKQKVLAEDRLILIQTLNALPQPQFNELVFALNVPNANVPSHSACQGDRTTALLRWAESPVGPGLPTLERILGKVIGKASQTAEDYLSFAIAGKLGDMSPDELQAIVQLLRKKTGDSSIEIAFSREGSIKLILSGSSEGLNKLQELFESGELEDLKAPPVENVQSVENNTTDARKARLVQALRLQKNLVLTTHRRWRARARACARIVDCAFGMVLVIAYIFTRFHDRLRDRFYYFAHNFDQARARTLDLRNVDLSGANLRNVDLSRADLSRANLTDADVTGTIFGDNKGLTEEDKRNLKRRGAIFQDSPGSNVSSLMLE